LLLVDPRVGEIEKEIEALYHNHFSEQRRDRKLANQRKVKALRQELGKLLSESVMAPAKAKHIAEWDAFDPQASADFFDPHWMFGSKLANGFDIVIGNPPYGAKIPSHIRQLIAGLYSHQNNLADSYLLFIEKAYHLLKPIGVVSYIVSNTWLPSLTFQKIRRFLTSAFTWKNLLIIQTKVFSAIVDTNVFLFEKDKPHPTGALPVYFYEDDGARFAHVLQWSDIPKGGESINVVFNPQAQALFRKMSTASKPLKDIAGVYNGVKPFERGKGTPPQTAETMRDKPFVAEDCPKPSGENWMPLLRGSLIHRYVTYWNNDSWIQYGPWLAAPRDASIFQASEKLYVRQTGDSIISTYGTEGYVARDNLHIILPKCGVSLKFILGVLNSTSIAFLYSYINPEKGEALAQVKKNHVEELPIPQAPTSLQARVIKAVDVILNAKKSNPDADTTTLEREIDQYVYALYGLTPEEIAIVECMEK
ncbi:MAG: Eco57I restriction-modification methylase domain-containing protein, partial [Opitutaceae bacterium]|nr:Eco57I restriction-modification methylase domain-containing protein [Opitutaceae bacterium]